MSELPKILTFAGSLRTESYNKKLARVAAAALTGLGTEVTLIDLRDFQMPVYDGDLEAEEGLPENALRLKELFKANDGFWISSPEYNSSIPGALKNTLDWVSRPAGGEAPLEPYTGKVIALSSASPGALGGMRGLVHLRAMLGNIGALVVPTQVSVPRAHEAFTPEGELIDPKVNEAVNRLAQSFVELTSKLTS